GRGQKGAGARKSSGKGKLRFEGGQMPLQQRLPKRGFRMKNPKEIQIVNLKALEALTVTDIDVAVLKENGLIRKSDVLVKVLGFGEITKAITVKVNEISKKAQDAIEAQGGKVELV
ncbi:MAG: 50S ribosomal protein L15, partial [Fibrobacterales bacterium]